MEENTLDFSVCLICKKKNSEELVENPTSHGKVLEYIQKFASYGDVKYFDLWSKLKLVSVNVLQEKNASWHRSCYKNTVHTGMLKRAKER